MHVKRLFFWLSRRKFLGSLIGFSVAYLMPVIPVNKKILNKKVACFVHPVPSYPVHMLIIPRKIARTVFSLTADDFYEVIQAALKARKGDERDFSLVINGGKRQDVMQAHFHLFTGGLDVEKDIPKENVREFWPEDMAFWEHTVKNMHDLLLEAGKTKSCFSIAMQFKNGARPEIFII